MNSGLIDGTTIDVIEINEHLTAFYTGRDPKRPRVFAHRNWHDDGAMELGVATYAIHSGAEAIVIDSFPSPAQAQWVRDYLQERGIRRFTLVLTHWHLDHIGGNVVYRDSPILASAATADLLTRHQAAIEEGSLHGLPAIKPLLLPTSAYQDKTTLRVGKVSVELRNINIHSADSTLINLPEQGALLAGDTLEDTVTYLSEVDQIDYHVHNLHRLRQMQYDAIYPNHGDPAVLSDGGYTRTLIDATLQYLTRMVAAAHDPGFLRTRMKDFIGEAVDKGWISSFDAYEGVHAENLKMIYGYFRDKPLPDWAKPV